MILSVSIWVPPIRVFLSWKGRSAKVIENSRRCSNHSISGSLQPKGELLVGTPTKPSICNKPHKHSLGTKRPIGEKV
ncbi:hypothetical protein IFM89_030224 [Coptis chinensis]|uniref:Uncharacterized protein n=1 Tax=Coptis chinensis TaxID=261450 RepID=A0A835M159_9MAGN|nr:hypothetical protein IFM89_030224 [Coptis chinensis]